MNKRDFLKGIACIPLLGISGDNHETGPEKHFRSTPYGVPGREVGNVAVESVAVDTIPMVTDTVSEEQLAIPDNLPDKPEIIEDSSSVETTEALLDDHKIPRELLYDGNKIADIAVTNPDGKELVNIPLFVLTSLTNVPLVDELLGRGAVLYVAHPEVNPEYLEGGVGYPKMGLPGELLDVANIMAHNKTSISPDFDGDPATGNEGQLQTVFDDLDKAQIGALLTFDFVEAAGLEPLEFVMEGSRIVDNVEPDGPGTGVTPEMAREIFVGNYEQKDSGIVQLMKCWPDYTEEGRRITYFAPLNQ